MAGSLSVRFSHEIFAAQKVGGVSRYFVELARQFSIGNLARTFVDAPLYVTDGLAAIRGMAGVEISGAWSPAFFGVTRISNALSGLRERSAPTDIFHATWYSPPPKYLRSSSYVVTVHDMIAELFPDQVKGGREQVKAKANAVRDADLVCCVSENTRRDLVDILGVPSAKTVVTPLASTMTGQAAAPVFRKTPFLLYVGQRSGYKNFEALAEAFVASPTVNQQFELVCFGGGSFNEREEALAGRSGGRIIQVGGGDAVLAGLYDAAALYVAPSLYEGFGLPMVEAMSRGCPVLTVKHGAAVEVGQDAVEYINEGSISEIRFKLEDFLRDDSRRKDLGGLGRRLCSRYSWAITAGKTVGAYEVLR